MSYALRGTSNVEMWLPEEEIEQSALEQIRNVSKLPWVSGYRVMPDAHHGIGCTIGSVIAMENALCPAAVGVDLGCGVSAVRTSLTVEDLPDSLAPLRSTVEAKIPVAHNGHEKAVSNVGGLKSFWDRFKDLNANVKDLRGKAEKQLGTLGAGNHFLEVCSDSKGRVWLTLHSGSRNIGKVLAEQHIAIAKKMLHNADVPDKNLAVFIKGTPEMKAYRDDLWWAQDYAAKSREVMMKLFCDALEDVISDRKITYDSPISVHHNYVAEETYGGVEVLVTRKGAIRAGKGDLGMIPGSMGVGSYIVRGLGNEASYCSASHGAGRKMSRSAAKKQFTVEDLELQTSEVECRKDCGIVDEIPAAYKDLDYVMDQQKDLVEIVEKLTTLMCVKG